MLDQAQTHRALEKLADSFLNDRRPARPGGQQAGWGQFVGQTAGSQVGLYGTCAGLITVASAYGHARVPQSVVDYLSDLWQQRHNASTPGPRYFALTARLAFFLLALRQSQHPSLVHILADADCELRARILNDGLFVSWQIDHQHRDTTGDEFSTAIAILAYGLTASDRIDIPREVRHAAESLQIRIEGSAPSSAGVRKFYLAAVTTALDQAHVSRKIKRLVRLSNAGQHSRDQDCLYFWDYWYQEPAGMISRRDYFHVPSDAMDILIACGSAAGRFQRLASLDLAEEDVSAVLSSGLYRVGQELAASNNQAWMSLALSKVAFLASTDTATNRLLLRFFGGIPENIVGNIVFPASTLALAAVASATPDRLLEFLQLLTLVGPITPSWWGKVAIALQILGLIVLPAYGGPLATRIWTYVRSRLP
jgi:hypothetical protein